MQHEKKRWAGGAGQKAHMQGTAPPAALQLRRQQECCQEVGCRHVHEAEHLIAVQAHVKMQPGVILKFRLSLKP